MCELFKFIIVRISELRSRCLLSVTNCMNLKAGPDLLPLEPMLKLCLQLVTVSDGAIKQAAVGALLAVAESCSGQEGCAYAGMPEINVLLDALYSPFTNVREVALRALTIMKEVLPSPLEDLESGIKVIKAIWMSCHDSEQSSKKHAEG